MTDKTLQKLFEELKDWDMQRTPDFQIVLKQSKTRPGFRILDFTVPLALAASLLAAAMIYSIVSSSGKPSATDEITQWESISEWTAPSDIFLTASNSCPISDPVSTSSDQLFDSSSPASTADPNSSTRKL